MSQDTAYAEVANGGTGAKRLRTWLRVALATASGTLLAALVAGFALLLWQDVASAELVPPGVTVDGMPVGGLSAKEAAGAIDRQFGAPLDSRQLTARVASETYGLDVSSFLSVDASGVASDARSLRSGTTLLERLRWVVLDERLDVDLPPRRRFDDVQLARWLADLASRLDTPAMDATRSVDADEGVFMVVEEREGRELDQRRSFALLRDAMLDGQDGVDLPLERVIPLRTAENLGIAIHVDLSERRLYLWEGAEIVGTYGVAVGAAGFPTPRGSWQIISKRYMPTWGNPGSAWAASMPRTIPPGPGNPLGTRALNLSAPGIRIHGTSQDWSIGTAASHGCMRMHRWDVEDLYERVQVGTPVFITS